MLNFEIGKVTDCTRKFSSVGNMKLKKGNSWQKSIEVTNLFR